jgi:hypothetical protein
MEMSDKHSPRVDDELQKDTRAGEEAREAKRVEDKRPDVVLAVDGAIELDEADRRAELARFIDPSVYPAEPAELLESARRHFADDWVIDALSALPHEVYENTQQVWRALGGRVEQHRA